MIDLQSGERGVEWELDLGRERRKLKSHHAVMALLWSPVLACDFRVLRSWRQQGHSRVTQYVISLFQSSAVRSCHPCHRLRTGLTLMPIPYGPLRALIQTSGEKRCHGTTRRTGPNRAKQGNSNSFELLSEVEDDTNKDEITSSTATRAGTSTRGRPLKRTQPYDPESPP
jgi:hypothetical protein